MLKDLLTDATLKDALTIIGAIVGLVVAAVTIIDKLLIFKDRRKNKSGETGLQSALPSSVPGTKRSSGISNYLFREILIIIGAGIVFNYIGLAVSVRLQSVLYLDMIGTAFTAFLLGPWWGATVGVLSNSLVNWLLFPNTGADTVIFPWSVVNMTGGVYWGIVARTRAFHRYLDKSTDTWESQIWFLFVFGILGAFVMSFSGTSVQAALMEKTSLSLNETVANAIDKLLPNLHNQMLPLLRSHFSQDTANNLSWVMPNILQNWFRYIPDKSISAAIALVLMRYCFPLFERELIHNCGAGKPVRDIWTAPLITILVYFPSCLVLNTADKYHGETFWPLWSAPMVILLLTVFALLMWGPSGTAVHDERRRRIESYIAAMRVVERETMLANCFSTRLSVTTTTMSIIFVLGLPFLKIPLVDMYQVAFNFFCVVYGFVLLAHLIKIGIAQNIAVSRKESQSSSAVG